MPWKQNTSGGGRGPWGQGSQGPGGGQGGGGGGGPGGPEGPDLEELLRRSQDRFKRAMPNGGAGPTVVVVVGLLAVLGYFASGIYFVQPAEQGVVTTFGDFDGVMTEPGPRYHLPWPIQDVTIVDIANIRSTNVGTTGTARPATRTAGGPSESLMLTGDENIVDMDFTVQWQVADPAAFLFNVQNAEETVRAVAESVMREVVGRTDFQAVLNERGAIEQDVRRQMQQVLDEYRAGVTVTLVNMQTVDPPAAVIEDYRDVQRARTDRERVQNEAEAYRNKVVPEARGLAQQILQEAQAYREQVVAEARGEADRFVKIYGEYAKAKDVTRQRLYLETLEKVLAGANKIIIEDGAGGGDGVVPYLPLPEVQNRRARSAAPQSTGGQ